MYNHIKKTNLFSRLDVDFKKYGFIGDTSIPQLVWLASQTRHFSKPVSLVILGPSGSGKSFALKTGLHFSDPAASEILNGMSEKALIYSVDLDLKHKHLIIQEAAGLKEGNGRTFLRQLLSEGEARYITVESTEEGLNSREIIIEGPTGLMMTTTANGLHAEDSSRVLSLNIHEDEKQVKQVLLAQAKGRFGSVDPEQLERWRTLSEVKDLANGEVDIPYAALLADLLPTGFFRIQRDFTQVLSLVKACALLHRKWREVDSEGRVVADLTDYEIVHGLVAQSLNEGLETDIPPNIRSVIEAVDKLTTAKLHNNSSNTKISQRTLADFLKRDPSVVSRNVGKAIELGYLTDINPGQGREADIQMGGKEINIGKSVLPEPSELRLQSANSTIFC